MCFMRNWYNKLEKKNVAVNQFQWQPAFHNEESKMWGCKGVMFKQKCWCKCVLVCVNSSVRNWYELCGLEDWGSGGVKDLIRLSQTRIWFWICKNQLAWTQKNCLPSDHELCVNENSVTVLCACSCFFVFFSRQFIAADT